MTRAEAEAIPSSFPTTYAPTHDPQYAELAAGFERWNTVGAMGKLTSMFIDLRRWSIPTYVEECGRANAFYVPRKREIHICYELIAEIRGTAYDDDAHFLVAFTTLHEIAHALIHNLAVEVDHEEDRADQFALLMLTKHDDVELSRRVIHAPAELFMRLDEVEGGTSEGGTSEGGASAADAHDDPHSAPLRRAANAICVHWSRTRDPLLAERMVERGARCDELTRNALAYWNRVLAPYTRLEGGRMF